MEQLIIYLARALVDQPDQVSLRASEVDGARLYELKVAPEDVGKVIGRDGRTVGALRTLLGAAAQKQGQKVRLEIQDDRRQQGQAPTPSPEGQ
ncbi:KH domain-containing protein [Archangium sp.]|uniref:KH domain-containing protein n=1 Tax=Archangium sp. TaxID=1872627 RepID=UPI00286CEE14|nr:KH domain-containing protein [Archangium sp.]